MSVADWHRSTQFVIELISIKLLRRKFLASSPFLFFLRKDPTSHSRIENFCNYMQYPYAISKLQMMITTLILFLRNALRVH